MKTLKQIWNKTPQVIFYFLTFVMFFIAASSRLLFNGMIFEFDYHLYQPDGAVYTYMTLKFAGFSHIEAAREVIAWYSINGEPGTRLTLSFFSPETNPGVWSLGSTRVIYPILSIPFVLFLGIPGMLVVPVGALLVLLILITRLSIKLGNPFVGLGIVFLLTVSPTITRWYVANITDGLLATVVAAAGYLLVRGSRNDKFFLFFLALVIVVGSFVRFSAPFWLAFAVVYWWINKRTAVFIFATSMIAVAPTLLAKPDPGSIVAGADGGVVEKLLYFPVSALRVLFIEFAQLAALDRPLLSILLTAICLSITKASALSSRLFITMGFAGWFIGALNGVLGVNFRYQLPLLFFAAWVILDRLKISGDGPFGKGLNVMRNEPQKKLNSNNE